MTRDEACDAVIAAQRAYDEAELEHTKAMSAARLATQRLKEAGNRLSETREQLHRMLGLRLPLFVIGDVDARLVFPTDKLSDNQCLTKA